MISRISITCIVVLLLVACTWASSLTLTVQVLYNGSPLPSSISLRGSGFGLNWNKGISMNKINSTTWSASVQYDSSNAGKQLEMKPLISDSTWSIGSNFIVNLPSVSSTVQLYPWFRSSRGQYSVVGNLYSPQLNNTRSIIVYTPPSYYENTLKVQTNVLVMHDGQNLFNDSTSFSGAWHCQRTIDQLVVQGGMEEVLIIGVYNTPDRLDEYTYSYDSCYDKVLGRCQGGGGKGDLYLDFLIENVIPWSADRFRIATARKNLGIMGSSLGGLISCYGAWTRPSVFGKGGCMSSSFWWNDRDFNGVILEDYPAPPLDEKLYLDSGDCCPSPGGDDHYQTLEVTDHIQKLGFVMNSTLFYYLDKGGQHNEYYWGQRFYIPMLDLYPITPTPTTPSA